MESSTFAPNGPMFAPRRGSLKDQISVHHMEGAQTDRTTQQIYNRPLPSLHFLRWRPMFHLLAPNAWMNDPCGPAYDPTTRQYHISFQWNPRRNRHGNVAWGHVGWGSATSTDLLSWKLRSAPTLKPDTSYDQEGIFTGCVVPTGADGTSGKLTAVYTSVSGHSVHYSLPYTRGCETQSIAQSIDGGKTWVKWEQNPILSEPPTHLQPCGWRDPYVAPWASLDELLGQERGQNLYGTISGGIAGVSPTLFLYAISRNQLDKWQFISPLISLGPNHELSRWSGDMGRNWEAGTFMTLSDGRGMNREFIVVGSEGCKASEITTGEGGVPQRSTQVSRAARSQQWMSGELVVRKKDSSANVELSYRFGGRFDHGCLYGVNTFWDPINAKQIAWGWIREEDLPQHLVDRQNWSGLMSLPRELRLLTLQNVTGTIASPLQQITSIEVTPSTTVEDTFTVRTLGICPAANLQKLHNSCRELTIPPGTAIPFLGTLSGSNLASVLDVQTCRFEVATSISMSKSFARSRNIINISISHSADHSLLTTLSFSPSAETLTLHRPDSSSVDPAINASPEIAPHTLFTFRDPNSGDEVLERYDVRMWFDESVLEAFANDRTVISSRIYPGRKRVWGVMVWVSEDRDEDTEMQEAGADSELDTQEEKGGVKPGRELADKTSTGQKADITLAQAKAWDGLRADIRIV